jgi:hypothetical protein
MNANGKPLEPPDLSLFNENRSRFPPEMLLPFVGQHVAWSSDGLRILANGNNLEEVEARLEAAGIDLGQVVFGFVPPADGVLLG